MTDKGMTVRQQKANTIRQAIESREVQLMDVMPDGLDLKRFIRTTLIAVSQNDDLLDCTPESLITSIFEAAECGIQPTGALGRGYLVPLKDHGVAKANFWIGYPGLIELAMRSGQVSKVWSRPVYEGDKFEVRYGTADRIVHEPVLGETDPNKITHVYACVQYRDGTVDFEVLTKAQVDAVRARARGANSNNSPWVSDYAEQAKKTAIRKLAKRLPLTIEAANAIQRDEEQEFGFDARRREAETTEKRASSLKDQLAERSEAIKETPAAEPIPDADGVVATIVEGEVIEKISEPKPSMTRSEFERRLGANGRLLDEITTEEREAAGLTDKPAKSWEPTDWHAIAVACGLA